MSFPNLSNFVVLPSLQTVMDGSRAVLPFLPPMILRKLNLSLPFRIQHSINLLPCNSLLMSP